MVLLIFLWNFIYMYEFWYNTLRYIINFTIEIMRNFIIFFNDIWWFKFYCLKDGIFEFNKKSFFFVERLFENASFMCFCCYIVYNE